jgi:hypothetical protein
VLHRLLLRRAENAWLANVLSRVRATTAMRWLALSCYCLAFSFETALDRSVSKR